MEKPGAATIGSVTDVAALVSLIDALDRTGQLPRLILYNLNPVDNAALATLTGSFSEDGVAAKIQFGPAWWYNDHYLGISDQLNRFGEAPELLGGMNWLIDKRNAGFVTGITVPVDGGFLSSPGV